ncbi:TIGR03747 family integrating conjugative element membrane protein [Uliginosibacterium gangwonense]|uniref:TIGR03747 family integrating conjugative element membrane protein n=1 Tax=Uliginosibacterium gangwonense TaxID=392736 RepID=UPI000361A28E|nr:TIGR03747 family integrating conjugative element membrane protein [Uliginosibacterium gangwonense]
MSQDSARPQAPRRKGPRGPLEMIVNAVCSFVGCIVVAVVLGTLLEVAGAYSFWKAESLAGPGHAFNHLSSDFKYVQVFPRSILVPDTQAFTSRLLSVARWPYDKCGITKMVVKARALRAGEVSPNPRSPSLLLMMSQHIAQALEILVYVTQDVAVRLAMALFALPVLVLAILIGVVDGLVQRDVRKWSGGRESSFIYHHAKHYAKWFMTAGFSIYLGWPLSGFNPTYLLLAFAALTAFALAITCASFKKYL